MTIDGDRVEFAPFPGKTQKFHLDPTRTPKWINFTFHDVNRSGFRCRQDSPARRIAAEHLQFEGDKLHIVLGDDELEARPDSFERRRNLRRSSTWSCGGQTRDERKRLEQSEHAALQGTWIGVFKTTKGESHDLGSGVKLVVKGDRLRLDLSPADPCTPRSRLNVATHPWQLDLTATADSGG